MFFHISSPKCNLQEEKEASCCLHIVTKLTGNRNDKNIPPAIHTQPVRPPHIAVDVVKYVAMSGQFAAVEVPCYNKHSIWLPALVFADKFVQSSQCYELVGTQIANCKEPTKINHWIRYIDNSHTFNSSICMYVSSRWRGSDDLQVWCC